MLKIRLTAIVLPLLLVFGTPATGWSSSNKSRQSQRPTGTLQKMIVQNGILTMYLDVDRLDADGSLDAKVQQLRFTVAPNSFFSILVFNDLLRGAEQGSMALIPEYSTVPPSLSRSINQLVVEKLAADEQFDLAVRDAKTGFTFFNVEGHQYNYDANGQLLNIVGGRLLISKELANALGRPAHEGASVGKISLSAVMQPIEVSEIVSGERKSMTMPPLHLPLPGSTPGPDVIVGDSAGMVTTVWSGNATMSHQSVKSVILQLSEPFRYKGVVGTYVHLSA